MSVPEAVILVKVWYENEPERAKSRIGIPNAGLRVLEIFRQTWPLRERHYLTEGGGQVAGLSGAGGDAIIARFAPGLGSVGTEAGRTSRSTPGAARRLAKALNEIPKDEASSRQQRALLSDTMQRWIVQEVLAELLQPSLPPVEVTLTVGSAVALKRFVDAASVSFGWYPTVRAMFAELGGRYFSDDFLETEEDGSQIWIADMAFLFGEIPTMSHAELARGIVRGRHQCTLIVPGNMVVGSRQLMSADGLGAMVDVHAAEDYLAVLIDCLASYGLQDKKQILMELTQSTQLRLRKELGDLGSGGGTRG